MWQSTHYKFELYKSDVVVEGIDISLLASGTMVHEAKMASEMLKAEGVNAEVISINMVKPLDKETILKSVKKTNNVIVCENHNVYGGVYSAIAEMLCQEYPVKCGVIGVNDAFGQVGKYDELLKAYNMTKEDIVKKAKEQLYSDPAAYFLVHCGGRKLAIGDRIDEVHKHILKETKKVPKFRHKKRDAIASLISALS